MTHHSLNHKASSLSAHCRKWSDSDIEDPMWPQRRKMKRTNKIQNRQTSICIPNVSWKVSQTQLLTVFDEILKCSCDQIDGTKFMRTRRVILTIKAHVRSFYFPFLHLYKASSKWSRHRLPPAPAKKGGGGSSSTEYWSWMWTVHPSLLIFLSWVLLIRLQP